TRSRSPRHLPSFPTRRSSDLVAPDLLILDEPTGRLESRVRAEFRDEIRRLHGEVEATTLVLTHAAREALALADRLAILDQGRRLDRKSTRLNSSHVAISYAVF